MNWPEDIRHMHEWFGTSNCVTEMDKDTREQFMELRLRMITEEVDETMAAYLRGDTVEIVDGIIDLCVFAIGTLDLFGVDADKAWKEVLKANLTKEVGIKEGRDNPFNLPDLKKPEGWKSPTHTGNTGLLP